MVTQVSSEKACKFFVYYISRNCFVETFQDPNFMKEFQSVIEKLCEVESDFASDIHLLQTVNCQNIDEFDKVYNNAIAESKQQQAKPVDSTRYKNFTKDLEDIQYVAAEPEANTAQGSATMVDDMAVQDEGFTVIIDPISKLEIKDPVRNTVCNHVYDKASIEESIKMNPRLR